MKFYYILLILLLTTACGENNSESTNSKYGQANDEVGKDLFESEQIDTVILGDINHDNKSDTAFIYTPPLSFQIDKNGDTLFSFGCKDNFCFNRITFSSEFPEIKIENSVWGQLEITDDINSDGVNEVLFASNWFTTNRSDLYLFSFKNRQWIQLEKVSFRNYDNSILKNRLIKKNHKYYLIGTKLIDGDETEVLKEIIID